MVQSVAVIGATRCGLIACLDDGLLIGQFHQFDAQGFRQGELEQMRVEAKVPVQMPGHREG